MDVLWRDRNWKESLALGVPALSVLLILVWGLSQLTDPAPPRSITISTGSESGAYFQYGKRYAEVLARSGVELKVITSEGSAQNLERLMDPGSGADLGLMQGGLSEGKANGGLVSLGRVFQQPIWVFYRDSSALETLDALKGKRISVGPIGSGTQLLAMKLLAKSGVTAENATIINKSVKDSAAGLKSGDYDAIFLALAPDTPLVKELLGDQTLRLMSMAHADAYTRLYPFLRHITLPRGMVDIERGIPPHDIHLIANEAALVARANLHPALADLMAEAAYEVHREGGMFHKYGDYPKAMDPEYALSEDAERFYKSGVPFLRRFFPFWVANFIERMAIFVVPLATILYPLMKGIPLLYQWRIRRRMLRYFHQLKVLELRIARETAPILRSAHRAELDGIDREVRQLPVPINYTDQYYDLRAAVELVREKLGAVPRPA